MNPEFRGPSSGTGSDAGRAPPCEHPTVDLRATTSGRLTRSSTDRVVVGVAGGIGERIGVDPIVVRLGFGLLVLAGGIGFVLYLVGILVSVDPDPAQAGPAPRRARLRPTIALAAILAGLLLILRDAGLWFGDGVVWSMALGAIGSAVLWSRADVGRSRLASFAARGHGAPVRTVAGVLLIGSGVSLFLVSGRRSGLLANAPLAAAAAIVGVVVIVGPWFWRLGRQLTRSAASASGRRSGPSRRPPPRLRPADARADPAPDDPRRMRWPGSRSANCGAGCTPDDARGHTIVPGAIDGLAEQIEREHGSRSRRCSWATAARRDAPPSWRRPRGNRQRGPPLRRSTRRRVPRGRAGAVTVFVRDRAAGSIPPPSVRIAAGSLIRSGRLARVGGRPSRARPAKAPRCRASAATRERGRPRVPGRRPPTVPLRRAAPSSASGRVVGDADRSTRRSR